MSVNAIGSSSQNQTRLPAETLDTKQEKSNDYVEINQLKGEIKQAESEMKETAKEVQKAVGESPGGASEKVQMLQNKMQLQQQAILMTQMKIKEIESPSKAVTEQLSADTAVRPRVDQYVAGEDVKNEPDNVYRVEEEDGMRTIVFNRPEN